MKREEILVNCIDEIRAGKRTLEECAARYPELASELRELVGILGRMSAESIAPSPEFKQRVRNRLVEVMASTEARHHTGMGWLRYLPIRKLGYGFTVASVLLAAGSGGAVYASQGSLPSDTLYPVKTSVEKLQLAFTFDTEAKANLHLKLAERRIEEVVAESASNRPVSEATLEAIATQIDGAISGMSQMQTEQAKALLGQLSQSTLDHQASLGEASKAAPEAAQAALKRAIDVTRRGNLIAQVAASNPAFLAAGASARDERLESGYFEIQGSLLSVEGRNWNIGGIVLRNVNAVGSVPAVGSGVQVRGVVRGSEVFVSKVEEEEDATQGIKIKGIFTGASASGAFWNIGGIPVGAFQDATPPPVGNRLELKGTLQNGVFTVNGMEGKAVASGESKASGVLQRVDTDKKTIAVDIAGANVTINVGGATIQDSDGRPLDLNEMESTVGKDIQAGAIYKSKDKLYANDIRVDSSSQSRSRQQDNQEQKTKPGETQNRPAETPAKPDETKSKQDDNQSRPSDNKDRRGDSQTKPGDSQARPSDTQNNSDSRQSQPRDRSGDTRDRAPDTKSDTRNRD